MSAGTVVVTNAGRHPELAELAAGLVDTAFEVSYWTSLSWAHDDRLMTALTRLPDVRPVRLALNRRLPEPLSRRHVHRRAWAREMAFQTSLPISQSWSDRMLRSRTQKFARTVGSELARRRPTAVIAQSTNAGGIFESMDEHTLKLLNYPIAHHAWIIARMAREKHENAGWSKYLQLDNPDPGRLRELDREIALADFILVPSSFVADSFVSAGVAREKLRVLPLGAEPAWFADHTSPDSSAGPSPEASRFTVLFAGQLTQRKGISYLIEAFAAANLTNSRLVLAGRPHAGIDARLSQYPFVDWQGSLSRQQLGNLYREADVLVLPSLAEGFPLVAIEAMTLGTPVIVSENTFAHDVIDHGQNGFVVPATDTAELGRTLTLMHGDRTLTRRLGRAAAQTAAQFTWKSYRANAANLVTSLILDRGSS